MNFKSTSSVHKYLSILEQEGYIRKDPTKPRAIEILDDGFNTLRKNLVNIPVVGTVAAGVPILAQENIESYVPVLSDRLPDKDLFILNVKGDSMINCGILNEDQIIVEQCQTAENGEIVVALVDDSATVKRFFKENGHFRLQPENDTMDPIILDEVSILGKVVGLLRFNIA
ncbi:SOS-response repressor and protease LexA [Lachnospiraceae bacterium TWA4]|nr:SOS-response repressor and protease LexA [Lachnospiraceae bacterium TWA4]